MAGCGSSARFAKSPLRRRWRTNFFHPSLFSNSTSRAIYVPRSELTDGVAGGWSLRLLAGDRADAGEVMVVEILGGD